MSVTVRVVSRIPQTRAQVQRRVDAAIRKAAFDIEAHAKSRAPVDTGNLRNAINASGGGQEWQVDSPAAYSIFVEFGTRFMGAQPYMVPALKHVQPKLRAALRSLA